MTQKGGGARSGGRTLGMSVSLRRQAELEQAIDEVVGSYAANRVIDNLESAALPNKRAVIDALNHLKPALYMGFYARKPLGQHNLRYYTGEHLYPAYEILVEQIGRAVGYEQACRGAEDGRDASWSEDVVLRFLRRLPALRELLNKDVEAAYLGDPAAHGVEEIIFSYPAIEAITSYRLAHELHKEQVPMIPRIMTEHAHSKTGIDIHPGAQIGESFFIDHGTGVVIGETTVIGDNVKIYQGVTLGALSIPRDPHTGEVIRKGKRHPTIEDNVTIYSGATILGGDTVIGVGSVIGGNVWLVSSIPPGSKITYESTVPGRRAGRSG